MHRQQYNREYNYNNKFIKCGLNNQLPINYHSMNFYTNGVKKGTNCKHTL